MAVRVPGGYGVITPEARAIAERRAAEDRETLARLVREGRVVRQSPGRYEDADNRRSARLFQEEIEQLVKPKVNLALRPRRRRR